MSFEDNLRTIVGSLATAQRQAWHGEEQARKVVAFHGPSVLRRFAEFRDLEGAFKRRSLTERAKGILMERHGVEEERAFQLLRDHTRQSKSTLVDTAQAIVDGSLRPELMDA